MSKDRDEKVGLPKIWLFVILVLGALILGDLNQRMADARRLEQEASQLESELQELVEDTARLEWEIEYATTEAYIEHWAHVDAKWVRPGEILVIPVNGSELQAEIGPSEDHGVQQKSNMEVWLQLLFGN